MGRTNPRRYPWNNGNRAFDRALGRRPATQRRHLWRDIARLDRFGPGEVRGQVFLVVVTEDGRNGRLASELVLNGQSANQIGPGGYTDSNTKLGSKFLGHDDGIAIVRSHNFINLIQFHDCRNEIIGHALNAVCAGFISGRQGRRFGRFKRMDFHVGMRVTQRPANAHDGAACTDPSDEGIRRAPHRCQLAENFRASGRLMSIAVLAIGKLAGQEHIVARFGERLGRGDGAQETALFAADQMQLRAERAEQAFAFFAHPVRHIDPHRMLQRTAERGHGDTGIAARRFGNHIPRLQRAARIAAAQDVQRHAVLDAAGQVVVLSLRIDDPALALPAQMDGQQRRAPNHPRQRCQTGLFAKLNRFQARKRHV